MYSCLFMPHIHSSTRLSRVFLPFRFFFFFSFKIFFDLIFSLQAQPPLGKHYLTQEDKQSGHTSRQSLKQTGCILRSENSASILCTQASATPTDPALAESQQFMFFFPEAAVRIPQGSTTTDLQREENTNCGEEERERKISLKESDLRP